LLDSVKSHAQGRMQDELASWGQFTVTDPYKIGAEDTEEGYDQLLGQLDSVLETLAGTKEMVEEAKVSGNTTALKIAAEDITASAAATSEYWAAEAAGAGPVPVPVDPVDPVWPCDGFCVMDCIAIAVVLVGLLFFSCGQKLHAYLICGLGMTVGTIAGLTLCDILDIEQSKQKWGISLGFGIVLWMMVMFVESVIFNLVGMCVGGAAAMLVYSVAAQYVAMESYYFFAAIGAGVILGYFLSSTLKAGMLVIIYSVFGGFLVASSTSYALWKFHVSEGDFWLENLTSYKMSLDLSDWANLVCIGVFAVLSVSGIFVQNSCCGGSAEAAGDEPTEKTPLIDKDAPKTEAEA